DLSSTGSEEVPVEGSSSGSDWGTEKEAYGHAYVGELKGRIASVLNYPSISSNEGSALGCVYLDEKGRIIDSKSKVTGGGKNPDLRRAVYLALKEAPDMEDPVPPELLWITQRGIC